MGVARCPLKGEHWKRALDLCGFQAEFKVWLLRSITEGVDIGYRGLARDHQPRRRVRIDQEIKLLSAQYVAEGKLGRVICVGRKPPTGRWFPRFFVSPNYTIPKKKKIGQPQKWRLIHNLSDHSLGHCWSINAGIEKAAFPVTYPSIITAAHEVFCKAPRGCMLWGRDLKAYYRHLMINPAFWWCTGTTLQGRYYVDCYCPFGARSMPAVFQRLSDAIRVIMLQGTPVDALLGMLDDFLGIVYRKVGESDTELLERSQLSAEAFDVELLKLQIFKQPTKDSSHAWKQYG